MLPGDKDIDVIRKVEVASLIERWHPAVKATTTSCTQHVEIPPQPAVQLTGFQIKRVRSNYEGSGCIVYLPVASCGKNYHGHMH